MVYFVTSLNMVSHREILFEKHCLTNILLTQVTFLRLVLISHFDMFA